MHQRLQFWKNVVDAFAFHVFNRYNLAVEAALVDKPESASAQEGMFVTVPHQMTHWNLFRVVFCVLLKMLFNIDCIVQFILKN